MPPERTAIVLFNLGGPDSPEAVKPFLFNLFNDPAIIGLPNPLRWLLAKLVSGRREKEAQAIYKHLDGKSPLLEETELQRRALEKALGTGYKVFISMRYWHPFAGGTAQAVKAYDPEHIILLPLYPQFSTTTSGSSFGDWQRAAQAQGITAKTTTVCCYPTQAAFIRAHAALLKEAIESTSGRRRVLFSAHGLPKKIIAKGDPYQWQVEQTAQAVEAAMQGIPQEVEFRVSYQSRVGPLEWIGPATDDEIKRAGEEGTGLIVVPIAFVSEHSETLVELDVEYGELAKEHGVPSYTRVPALTAHPDFIEALATVCREAEVETTAPHTGARLCPETFGRCPCRLRSQEKEKDATPTSQEVETSTSSPHRASA